MIDNGWNVNFLNKTDTALTLSLSGTWRVEDSLPSASCVIDRLRSSPAVKQINLDVHDVSSWDTGLLFFIIKLDKSCQKYSLNLRTAALPSTMRALIDLSKNKQQEEFIQAQHPKSTRLRFGHYLFGAYNAGLNVVEFIGLVTLGFSRFIRNKARFIGRDSLYLIYDCGIKSLGVILLVSFLIGLILALIGEEQMHTFGAGLYVANLVAIGLTREVIPLLLGITMMGRAGGSYVAQLGTLPFGKDDLPMKSAAKVFVDFLVIPRILALILMLPLLCLYGDFIGIFAGMLVSVKLLNISFNSYIYQTITAITASDITLGLLKSFVFGWIIAITGCYQGFMCAKKSYSIGKTTSNAVVFGNIGIILADLLIEVMLDALNINI